MKWLKWSGIVLLLAVLLFAAGIALGLYLGERRLSRHIELPQIGTVAMKSDAASIARGRYLYSSRGCGDCHGADGAGATIADDGHGTKLAGPNITVGNPRIAAYTPVDWVASIRHGVGADRRPLRLMPSEDFNRLTDDDLASVVAYVRQLKPQRGAEVGVIELPLPARVLYGFGAIPEAATKIDHALPPSTPVPDGVTPEYGRYVAQSCLGCHGAQLQGGKIAGAPPDWPAAARLAPGKDSVMPRYADAGVFVAMMRSGRRPDGSAIGVMPFNALKTMSETDLRALHAYLMTQSS